MSSIEENQQKRAWEISFVLMVLLGVTSLLYGKAHYSYQDKQQQPKLNISKNIQITQDEITKAKKLLEKTQNLQSLQEQLKIIEPNVNQVLEQAKTLTEKTQQEELTQAGQNINDLIEKLNDTDSKKVEEIGNYVQFLSLIEKDLQNIQENENNELFFWQSPPLLWVEILFWGWVGTILYLLSEIYTYYKADSEQQKFIELTPWYFITLLRGTFIVFMILVGVTTINVGFGTSVNFSQAPATLYVFLAGILGYFNRMAKEQLIIMVEAVFPDAWERANPDEIITASSALKIISDKTELNYGEEVAIKVDPPLPVKWTTKNDLGLFDPKEGLETVYKAPTEKEATDSTTGTLATDIAIVVTSVTDPSKTAEIIIPFKAASSTLKIIPDKTELNYGEAVTIKVDPQQPVKWTTKNDLGLFNPQEGLETVYTAPIETDAKDSAGNLVTEVTIVVTLVADPSQTVEMVMGLKTS